MDAYNDRAVNTIVVMSSAQVGKTEIINNIVGYVIDQNPGPMLVLQPTLEMSQTWSKDRLAPMLRDSPCLRGKVKDPRARDSGNTMLHKTFTGGQITMAGANSPASLASRPIRDVLADEVDRYPYSAGSEGDPISLARKRSTTFWNRKLIITSTPTVKGASAVERWYDSSDQRRFYVPCPHCNEMQVLTWAHIQWDNDTKDPNTTRYICIHCGAILEEKDKPRMIRRGEWRANAPFKGVAGFHLNELYSPWKRWSEVVADFFAAKDDPETLRVWINTSLGETWEEQGEQVESIGLLNNRENYPAEVPAAVVVLTCGVDVQDDRLEAEIVGYTVDRQTYSIEYAVFHGDPSQRDVWDKLDHFRAKHFNHESGLTLSVSATGIDSGGHFTQVVYNYGKERYYERVYVLKGVGGGGRPMTGRPTRNNRLRVRVYPVGVDTAKESIYARLKVREPGPGYCHFPAHYDEEYFRQLTAERIETKFIKGYARRVWVKKRARNEALDVRVYADAALDINGDSLQRLADVLKERIAQRGHVPKSPPPKPAGFIGSNSDWFNKR